MRSRISEPSVEAINDAKMPGRIRIWWAGCRDGRAGWLPESGTTPTVDIIAAAARSVVAVHRRRINAEIGELVEKRQALVLELEASKREAAKASAVVDGLPSQPAEADLPDRPVPANPALVASLRRTIGVRELKQRRAAAEGALRSASSHCDALVAGIGQLDARLQQLPLGLRDIVRQVATSADIRITHYTAVLLRWHRDPERLSPLLPLPRLADQIAILLDPAPSAIPTED